MIVIIKIIVVFNIIGYLFIYLGWRTGWWDFTDVFPLNPISDTIRLFGEIINDPADSFIVKIWQLLIQIIFRTCFWYTIPGLGVGCIYAILSSGSGVDIDYCDIYRC